MLVEIIKLWLLPMLAGIAVGYSVARLIAWHVKRQRLMRIPASGKRGDRPKGSWSVPEILNESNPTWKGYWFIEPGSVDAIRRAHAQGTQLYSMGTISRIENGAKTTRTLPPKHEA